MKPTEENINELERQWHLNETRINALDDVLPGNQYYSNDLGMKIEKDVLIAQNKRIADKLDFMGKEREAQAERQRERGERFADSASRQIQGVDNEPSDPPLWAAILIGAIMGSLFGVLCLVMWGQ